MFSKLSFHRSMLIGAVLSIAFICIALAVGAGLIASGVIGPGVEVIVICAAIFLGTIPGGMLSAGKKRQLSSSFINALIVYVVMWGVALASGRPIRLDTTGITVTLCLFAGSMVGGMVRPNPKNRKHKAKKSLAKEKRNKTTRR